MAVSPWGWKFPMTSPTALAHLAWGRSGRRFCSYIEYRIRRGPVGAQVLLVHRVQDPTVHGLEPVAHVGQRPRHDDGHGVLEERALHLLLDLDGLDRRRGGRGNLGPGAGSPVAATPAFGHVGLVPSCSSAWPSPPRCAFSDVEEAHVLGVGLDEVATQLDVVTHEHRAH